MFFFKWSDVALSVSARRQSKCSYTTWQSTRRNVTITNYKDIIVRTNTRFKLIGAVHLLLIRGAHVLLLRRFNTGYEDGNYSVPAGHLDGNEPVSGAMAREALEETGISINSSDLRVVHVMHRRGETVDGSSNERIDFFLTASAWEGDPQIIEPNSAISSPGSLLTTCHRT